MAMSKGKRAFLARTFGEGRTKELEERLPLLEKALEEMGVGWKSDDVMLEVAPLPMGGATSFAEVDKWQQANDQRLEVLDLTDVFRIIGANVLADADLDTPAKAKLLEAAADDFSKRLGALSEGEKALLERRLPQAGDRIVYGDKVLGDKALGILSRTPEGRKAASPAAAYVQDVISMLQGPQPDPEPEGQKGEPLEGPAAHIDDLTRRGAVRG